MSRFVCLFSILYLSFFYANASQAVSCGFEKLDFCFKERDEKISEQKIKKVKEIVGSKYATISKNQWKFYRLPKDVDIEFGYTQLHFSFVDKKLNAYKDSQNRVKTFLNHSLWDWVKSIFVVKNKVYLVSIDVFAGADEGKLIGHKTLFYVSETESFTKLESKNALDLEGSVGFHQKSDEAILVKLTVRRSDKTDITLSNVKHLVAQSAKLAALTSNISSLVNTKLLSKYQETLNNVESALASFEEISEMTRRVKLQRAEGKIIAFDYDFLAPKTNFGRFKLKVGIAFERSLLTRGGARNASDILQRKIFFTENTKSLHSYIDDHDISKPFVQGLAADKPDVLGACSKIKLALSKRLISTDVILGLNAYIEQNIDKFKRNWDSDCLREKDLKILATLKIQPAIGFGIPGSPVATEFNRQIPIIDAVSVLIKNGADADAIKLGSDRLRDRQETQQIRLIDRIPIVLREASEVLGDTGSVIEFLLRAKADRGLACYNGEIHDIKDKEWNNAGALTLKDGIPVELIFKFEPSPRDTIRPKLVELIIKKPDPETMQHYRKSAKNRKNGSCAGGFKPWEVNTAEANN